MTENPIMVVTGASAGIGARTALVLARQGATLALVGRNEQRLTKVADDIESAGLVRPTCLRADFTRLQDVHELARRLRDHFGHVDALLNNAGVYCSGRHTTVDGHEVTNQVNHLAPFLLTHLLWDLLTVRPNSRVVMTGSLLAEGVRPDDLDRARVRWSGWGAYKATKQANALFALELARRAEPGGPVATCCHPGMLKTEFASESALYRRFRKVCPWLFKPVDHGAEALANLATGDDGVKYPGAFFNEKKRLTRLPKRLSDTELAARLWEKTEVTLKNGAWR